MPTVPVPADEPEVLIQECAGSSITVEVETDNAEVRLATSPNGVRQGEVVREGRPVTVDIPDTADTVWAKAYGTTGSAQVYVNRDEGTGLSVTRDSPTVLDRVREDITVETSSASLFDKFATFEVSANYSHQFAPSWNYIGEIGITIISAEAEIEIKAGDDDNDQMAIDSPMVFDKTEVQSFKLHDPNSNTPRIVGWYSGVDT